MTKMGVGALTAVAMGASASTALAADGNPHQNPQPACLGIILAQMDQNSGSIGPSGNSQASTGPGYFFGPATGGAVQSLQDYASNPENYQCGAGVPNGGNGA
jgi:hypothetical protein